MGVHVGAAPPVFERGPKTTRCAGGVVAWSRSAGTTWHSAQATGAATDAAGFGFKWARCAPTAFADAAGEEMGGADDR